MKKTICFCLACLLLGFRTAALADPLTMAEDLQEEVRIGLNGNAEYIYSFRYPQVDPSDPSAELINSFYQYKADDAVGFEIPMNADYYRAQGTAENVTVEITYQVTCNGEDFFSVLILTNQDGFTSCAGHTFSRKNIRPGSSVALPYLLGMLESEETDTWLQDRQTGKADEIVREMVWERLGETEGIRLREDLTREDLDYGFFPEEDFYLDEREQPVFYLQPGFAEESGSLTVIPISIEEILDEM